MYLCTHFYIMANKRKIINDPVFGFLSLPNELIYDVLQHPYVQRLNRIRQLGLSYLVYPGAMHSRFGHSLGAMHLMQEAITSLRTKGVEITEQEETSAMIAILLHDIGHGPFSHVLEHTLVDGVTHEDISLLMMERINNDLMMRYATNGDASLNDGPLDMAISIFRNEYPKHFLHQLISSQLDVDRMDYLCRDSFFTGVQEGRVASERLLKMLDVRNDKLVVQIKGIYSVQKFLVARRLMYWQVYLHKTTVGYEKILVNALKRAKLLAREGREIFASPALAYFLKNDIDAAWFDSHEEALSNYAELDDSDIWSALKVWRHHDDKILATLATDLVDRRLFKVEVTEEPPTEEYLAAIRSRIVDTMGISNEDASYMMSLTEIGKDMYNPEDDSIGILYKDGTVRDIAEASEILNVQLLSKKIRKYYLCYQRV